VPLGPDLPLMPDVVAEVVVYLGARPEGFEVVVPALDHVPTAEYAEAGATWRVTSRWPEGDWVDEQRRVTRAGPPR
jgi:hypothetical protein